jgi:DNA-binding NtrC family response regulator
MAGRTIEENNLPGEISNRMPESKPMFCLPELGIELERLEVDLIKQALHRTNGNRSRSARLLGISRDTLLYRMQKHGIT